MFNMILQNCTKINYCMVYLQRITSHLPFDSTLSQINYFYQMQSRPDYAFINAIESVLISQKPPTKLLSDTKCLLESQHVTDDSSFSFTTPAQQCLAKLQKICPLDFKSAGTDPNANLRAFLVITLQSVFNTNDDFYENILIEKINQQVPDIIKTTTIKNHSHSDISPENMLKVTVGFLKTLSNKKLKNPQIFDLLKQLQALPIILDYIILMFRAILAHYGVQNAQDFTKTAKDRDSYIILSEFFDINYVKKDSFYMFQESSLFIFQNGTQYIVGKYQLFGITSDYQQKAVIEIRQKYEENCSMQIMECSMESGSYLLSSRNAQQATPYFNIINGEQFIFKTNQLIQNRIQNSLREIKSKSMEQSKPQTKVYESKGSQFQVNIYSEEKDKFFNNKYKSQKRTQNSKNNDSNSDHKSKDDSLPKVSKKDGDKVFRSNDNTKPSKKIEFIKKVSSDKCLSPSKQPPAFQKQKSDSQKTGKSSPIKKLQNNQTAVRQNNHECMRDRLFEWQDQQKRLRRVETICYKTCSTCHRRFYRNQIQSNVIQVKVSVLPKQEPNKVQNNPKSVFMQSKNAPDFLNKKFYKKPNEFEPAIKSPINYDQSPRFFPKETAKTPQMTWLNKKIKTDNFNPIENMGSQPLQLQKPLQNFEKNLTPNCNNEPGYAKKVLSIKNLFTNDKQGKLGNEAQTIKQDKLTDPNENKTQVIQRQQMQPRIKSFFALKSPKQLQKIRSIDKFDFFKDKISKDGTFKSDKNLEKKLENTNNATIKYQTGAGQTAKDKKASDITRRRDFIAERKQQAITNNRYRNVIQLSKSADRRVPRFMKKQSLNTALDLIMNN